jgi:hypothetical protein
LHTFEKLTNDDLESDLKIFLQNLEKTQLASKCEQHDNDKKETASSINSRQLISSFLIVPEIRKPFSVISNEALDSNHDSEESISYLYEPNKYREKLVKEFDIRFNSLERHKAQTRDFIENLKRNLNELEFKASNSIYETTANKYSFN